MQNHLGKIFSNILQRRLEVEIIGSFEILMRGESVNIIELNRRKASERDSYVFFSDFSVR